MSQFVLDTDTLVLFQEGNQVVCQRVLSRPVFELATTVITIEEQLSGWYSLLRKVKGAQALARAYQRLADNVAVLSQFPILSFTETAIAKFDELKRLKLGIKHMDLRIAAIVLVNRGTLVTRNLRDFQSVPGLVVEDWSI